MTKPASPIRKAKAAEPASGFAEESQHARFIEAARELGADDDEATFKEKLRVIARQNVKAVTPIKKPDDD